MSTIEIEQRKGEGLTTKAMSAREAKNAHGLVIDAARAEPLRIEKHGRGAVMVVSVREYEYLSARPDGAGPQAISANQKES